MDRELLEKFGLEKYRDFCENVETEWLNLIYDPIFDHVVERWVWDKTKGLMDWTCAICKEPILADRGRIDVENFVCPRCREVHNNTNQIVDPRILESRTKMFEHIRKKLYEELEDNLLGGKKEIV